ncbi:hypothetical protein L873DRAFT_1801052 [Choiromyces venosus 120613-1]|uniref:Uncharacterized protein n=1 Tax=Choiromyces venosus 120613-1 TaxID=1336337 RepID=A0A3N4K2G0_9PEZI|nr:hypothetical protein L873DRAFT_1801052 [Choiromyces venosus 120613-1]
MPYSSAGSISINRAQISTVMLGFACIITVAQLLFEGLSKWIGGLGLGFGVPPSQ